MEMRWSSIADSDAAYHIARHSGYSRRSVLHTHDFAEVFWVERGRAIHETQDGVDTVEAGHVVFVAPTAVHRYRSPTADFTVVNLAIPMTHVAEWRRRYGALIRVPWDGEWRTMTRPSMSVFARVQELAEDLGQRPRSPLHLDRLLLELLIGQEPHLPTATAVPSWLGDALSRWREDSRAMHGGVRGLAELAGRSREHVSRVIRESTGIRAIDLVNDIRMETAAGLLRMSDDPIPLIASSVGVPSVSHFYRLFRRRYRLTPRQYRISQRRFVHPMPPVDDV